MIEHHTIPITKIVSAACRGFMAFDGLHNFEFDETVNTIIGRNAGGKTSLIRLIELALEPNVDQEGPGQWMNSNNYHPESLLELKFIADGKLHYLRRVILGETTSDLHIYVGEGDDTVFLRDSEGFAYLKKLKPVTLFENFHRPYKDYTKYNPFKHKSKRSSSKIEESWTYIQPPAEYIDSLNKLLIASGSRISNLSVRGKTYVIENLNGVFVPLRALASGDSITLFILTKLLVHTMSIEAENKSRVILIDELEMGLSRSGIQGIYNAIRILANQNKCQFILTSRFSNGSINPIRVNLPRIPKMYSTHRMLVIGNPPFPNFGKMGAWISNQYER